MDLIVTKVVGSHVLVKKMKKFFQLNLNLEMIHPPNITLHLENFKRMKHETNRNTGNV